MTEIKIASWNIYFSHELISYKNGIYEVKRKKRTQNITNIIKKIDPHILGIIECMSPGNLLFFRDQFFPNYSVIIEGERQKLNLGIIFKEDVLDVKKVEFDKEQWKDKLGDDPRPVFYKWARVPLIVKAIHKETGSQFIVAVVHPKSKKIYSKNPLEREKEALKNRKRIVAEGRRLHTILWQMAKDEGTPFNKFIVMGDINDGPWFDKYEARILRSGVESYIGRVYEPDKILHSFVDLSDEQGIPTTPKSWGASQLDHILYTHDISHGDGLPLVKPDSGRVRDDLVDFDKGSGKKIDSDHCPIELTIMC